MRIKIYNIERHTSPEEVSDLHRILLEMEAVEISVNGIVFKGYLTGMKWNSEYINGSYVNEISIETIEE